MLIVSRINEDVILEKKKSPKIPTVTRFQYRVIQFTNSKLDYALNSHININDRTD